MNKFSESLKEQMKEAASFEADYLDNLCQIDKAELQRKVIVCRECLRASCWNDIFPCSKFRTGGTVEKIVQELLLLKKEHPSYFGFKADVSYNREMKPISSSDLNNLGKLVCVYERETSYDNKSLDVDNTLLSKIIEADKKGWARRINLQEEYGLFVQALKEAVPLIELVSEIGVGEMGSCVRAARDWLQKYGFEDKRVL